MCSLETLKNALLTIGVPVNHFRAAKQPDRYVVWAEEGQSGGGYADNRMTLQVLTGTVDYFTRREYDPNFTKIQDVLNEIGIAWRLNSIQYEEDTRYTHYEWVWEMEVYPDG